MRKVALYVHIPFCKSRCHYCDFNTYAGIDNLIPEYSKSIRNEFEALNYFLINDFRIETIYFGGGTPSYIDPKHIEEILAKVYENIPPQEILEISLEVNPADIEIEKGKSWIESGINRISLGMQSAINEELQLLGRRHLFKDVVRGFSLLRDIGFENINLDLIFGIPQQTLGKWKFSLKEAIKLRPDHLSLYSLTLEDNTPIFIKIKKGEMPYPDDDLAAKMYEWAVDFLEKEGYRQYEISNWAKADIKKDFRCRHNMIYWKNQDYIGLGVGAHSHFIDMRWENIIIPKKYNYLVDQIKKASTNSLPFSWMQSFVKQNQALEIQDTIMMGLRLVEEGIDLDDFDNRFGKSLMGLFDKVIKQLVKQELLELSQGENQKIRLTKKGRILGNQVFMQFIDEDIKKQ